MSNFSTRKDLIENTKIRYTPGRVAGTGRGILANPDLGASMHNEQDSLITLGLHSSNYTHGQIRQRRTNYNIVYILGDRINASDDLLNIKIS